MSIAVITVTVDSDEETVKFESNDSISDKMLALIAGGAMANVQFSREIAKDVLEALGVSSCEEIRSH
jgi:hypothetical protein